MASIDDMPPSADQTSLLGDTELLSEEPVAATPKPAPIPEPTPEPVQLQQAAPASTKPAAVKKDDTAPICYNCGNQTQRSGSCYVCTSCGSTTGCS
jgi:ribonucleoside-diphosphate reductase alpha chain